jgi:hypothetical protein
MRLSMTLKVMADKLSHPLGINAHDVLVERRQGIHQGMKIRGSSPHAPRQCDISSRVLPLVSCTNERTKNQAMRPKAA